MMRAVLLIVLVSLFVAGGADEGDAQAPSQRGNPQAGQQFALRKCDACHIVAANQDLAPMPSYGPSFFDVAKRPNITATTLRAFLSKPHPMIKMPYPDLTTEQISDVSAYILSLRGQH
jgi:mono/diheme cytochrome c family protein